MTSADSRRIGEVHEALVDLCRRGILVLGHSQGEPTFKVSVKFDECLKDSAGILCLRGGFKKDPLGDVALLALVNWCDGLTEEEAQPLFNALMCVLRVSLEAPL